MREPRDTIGLLAIPRLMVVILAIWAAWQTTRLRNRHASGTVIVNGTPFTIDACKKVLVDGPDSIGADLRSSDRTVLRVVRNEHGVQLWVYPNGSGGVALPIDRRDCSQWDVLFFSEVPDPIKPVGGNVTITCAVGGGKIDGTASFERCRS